MAINDSISQARSAGASAEAIVAEIERQNPAKASVFRQARSMGASAEQILSEIEKQNKPSAFKRAADVVNKAYGAYANAPVVKQASQAVGGVVGAAGGAIGALIGGAGETGLQLFRAATGKGFDAGRIAKTAEETAISTARFGYESGKAGAAAAPMGAVGRLPGLALAYGQGYQGAEDVSRGLKTGDAAQVLQGGLELGTAAMGARSAVVNKGNIISKPIKAPPTPATDTAKAAKLYEELLPMPKKMASTYQKKTVTASRTASKTGEPAAPTRTASDLYTLAADLELPIEKRTGPSGKPIIDTTKARETVATSLDDVNEALKTAIRGDSSKWFDARKFLTDAQSRIDSLTGVLAAEKNAMKSHITTILRAEAKQNGGWKWTGEQAQNAKIGLYKAGYPQGMTPARAGDIRMTAEIIKSAIEGRYKKSANVRQMNKRMSDLLELDRLLEQKNGAVINGGRMTKLFDQATGSVSGATVGGMVGSAFGPMGTLVGGLAGATAGRAAVGKITDIVSNPAYKTAKASKLIRRAKSAQTAPR